MYQDLWTKKSVSECFFVAVDRDAGGKILRREEHWPEGVRRFRYAYDASGQLLRVQCDGREQEAYAYNEAGQRVEDVARGIRMTLAGVSRMRARCAWPMTMAGGWSAGRVRALPPRGLQSPRSCGKPGPAVARSAAGKAGPWNSGMTATASLKCACRTARFDPIVMKETLVCLRGFWMTASCA